MNSIEERIKDLRTTRRLSQAEFARRLGVTGAAVSAYENGIRLPSYEVLLKVSRLFRVSTDFLLGLDDKESIDVTGLTGRQQSTVQELVSAYELSNRCRKLLKEEDRLFELGPDLE